MCNSFSQGLYANHCPSRMLSCRTEADHKLRWSSSLFGTSSRAQNLFLDVAHPLLATYPVAWGQHMT
eukprot:8977276-Karenia_brevis.AAC.1